MYNINPNQLSLFPTEQEITHMSPAPNFGALLDAAPSEVERPPSAPQGQYLTVVQGLPRIDKSSKKQTEFSEFTLKVLQAGPDVNPDELEEFLTSKDGTVRPLTDVTFKATFYHTAGSIWRLDEFHEHCGIDLGIEATRRQRSEECMNSQVVAYIKHEPSNDGITVFAKIGRTASAEHFGEE